MEFAITSHARTMSPQGFVQYLQLQHSTESTVKCSADMSCSSCRHVAIVLYLELRWNT